MIWAPPPYGNVSLNCQDCSTSIERGDIFGIHGSDLPKLNRLEEYQTFISLTCFECSTKEVLSQVVDQALGKKDSYDTHIKNLGNQLKEIVKEQTRIVLKDILREEAADPNGAFSPSP
jgi:hypothetical protein